MKTKNYHIEFEDICGYVRRGIIHPSIYIDSVPTHAHETTDVAQALVIGFCNLSAYCYLGDDEIIALCDNLLRGQAVTIRAINKDNLTQIRITSWMTQEHYFQGVPKEHISPKLFSSDLPITGFIFPQNKPMSIHIRNIAISHEALELLSNSLSHNSSSNLRLDSTEKKEADLKKAIHEIQMQAEKLECHFDIEAMPGTKAEFIALLRTRYPKATFCSITDKAIQKHLKKLGIKFKRGVKPTSD